MALRDQSVELLPESFRVCGSEDRFTLDVRFQVAKWTGEAGDAATAREQLAALLPISERVLGVDHPDTLVVRRDLARWTEMLGG